MSSKFLVVFTLVLLSFSCSINTDKIIYVADSKVDCVGVGPQKCLQIKEDGQADWTYFYNQIEGFDYEEGFFYKIKVDIIKVENPPADGSSLKYKLIEVLEKSKAPFNLDKSSWLVTRLNNHQNLARNPFIKIDLSQNDISGNTSCNRFSAKIAVSKNKVDISEISSTEYLCKTIDTEESFMKALNNIFSYTLTNGKLQLLDANKQILMECDYLKHE